jgi:translation initiation factor 5A
MAESDSVDAANKEVFESSVSVGSLSYPMQCSALRKNGFVLIKEFPCKIVDMSTSKTGKHGGAKVHLVGIDIFTGRKYEELCPSTHNMDVPNVERRDYQLIDITDDGFVSLLTEDGSTKDDLVVPAGDLGDDLKAAFADGKNLMVTVQAAMNKEAIISFKEDAGK